MRAVISNCQSNKLTIKRYESIILSNTKIKEVVEDE